MGGGGGFAERCEKGKGKYAGGHSNRAGGAGKNSLFDNKWRRGETDIINTTAEHLEQKKNNDMSNIGDKNVDKLLDKIQHTKNEKRRKKKKPSKKKSSGRFKNEPKKSASEVSYFDRCKSMSQ